MIFSDFDVMLASETGCISKGLSKSLEILILPSNILVAEDNLINQKLIQKILKKMGHTVTIVDNGAKAVQKAKSGAFDIKRWAVGIKRHAVFNQTVSST